QRAEPRSEGYRRKGEATSGRVPGRALLRRRATGGNGTGGRNSTTATWDRGTRRKAGIQQRQRSGSITLVLARWIVNTRKSLESARLKNTPRTVHVIERLEAVLAASSEALS